MATDRVFVGTRLDVRDEVGDFFMQPAGLVSMGSGKGGIHWNILSEWGEVSKDK